LHRNHPCFWGVERLQEAQLNLLKNAFGSIWSVCTLVLSVSLSVNNMVMFTSTFIKLSSAYSAIYVSILNPDPASSIHLHALSTQMVKRM
jgi:hypothetical protein